MRMAHGAQHFAHIHRLSRLSVPRTPVWQHVNSTAHLRVCKVLLCSMGLANLLSGRLRTAAQHCARGDLCCQHSQAAGQADQMPCHKNCGGPESPQLLHLDRTQHPNTGVTAGPSHFHNSSPQCPHHAMPPVFTTCSMQALCCRWGCELPSRVADRAVQCWLPS